MTYCVSLTNENQYEAICAMLKNTMDERCWLHRKASVEHHSLAASVIDNEVFFQKFKIIDFWENFDNHQLVFESEKDVLWFLITNR